MKENDSMGKLISEPTFDQIVIGQDGLPAVIVVLDPPAFTVH